MGVFFLSRWKVFFTDFCVLCSQQNFEILNFVFGGEIVVIRKYPAKSYYVEVIFHLWPILWLAEPIASIWIKLMIFNSEKRKMTPSLSLSLARSLARRLGTTGKRISFKWISPFFPQANRRGGRNKIEGRCVWGIPSNDDCSLSRGRHWAVCPELPQSVPGREWDGKESRLAD